ncbi:DUF4240 domain-containing protein [Breznakiellaceae bacterium SP9]
MNKDTFWTIIEKTMDLDTEIMYSNLLEELKILPERDVQVFRAYIGAYMELVNETIWVYMACKVINGYVSDDTGLYFTLWLISRGETVLLKALNDPDTLSELPEIPFGDADFEMLMGIGMDENEGDDEMDYELMDKLEKKIIEEISQTIKYKDGEKYGKYKTFEDGMEDIPNVLPKLIKRAEKEQFDWKNYI